MPATPGVPGTSDAYMEVRGFVAPTLPNEAETGSAAWADLAFRYAYQQKGGLLAPTFEGDRAALDALLAICVLYKTPPAAPTLTTLAPNTAVRLTGPFLMTLTGTGFAPGLTVIFGAVTETRVTVVSATSATVTVFPTWIPSAGTLTCKVRNGGGAADSGTQNFVVT